MTHKTNMNSWLFSQDPNKQLYRSRDTMLPERRQLLNDHLDGLYTKDELKEKLLELKNGKN